MDYPFHSSGLSVTANQPPSLSQGKVKYDPFLAKNITNFK